MNIEQLKQAEKDFDSMYAESKKRIENKIDKLESQLKELRHNQKTWCDWVRDLALELMKETGMKYYQIYGPFGLNCETSIHISNKRIGPEEHWKWNDESDIDICNVYNLSLTLRPDWTYNTYKNTHRYPIGSIGELNGENYIYEPLPNEIKDIVRIMKKQHRMKAEMKNEKNRS